MDQNELIPGLDASALTQVSGSQLYQMVAAALLTNSRGGLIVDNDEPDVVANPKFIRYFWVKPSEQKKITRVYNTDTSSWESQNLGELSVGTDELKNESVTLEKLFNPNDVDKAGWFLKVNGSGNGWVIEAFSIADGSITLTKLNKGAGNAGDIVRVALDDSGFEFATLDDLLSDLGPESIPLPAINTGGVRGGLAVINSAGTSFALLPPGVAGQILRTPGPNLPPVWSNEIVQLFTSQLLPVAQSIPAGFGQVTQAHGLAAIPSFVKLEMLCTVTDAGYAVGDYVPIQCFYFQVGDTQYPIGYSYNNTNIVVSFSVNPIGVQHKTTDNIIAIDRAKWNIVISAVK